MAPIAAEAEARRREARRRRRLGQELLVRALCAALILAVSELVRPVTEAGGLVRVAALLGVLLNGPYWALAATGIALRAQAYARMLIDVALITLGLYAAGGLAAAPYLGVYMVVPLYAGLAFSSVACLVATGAAIAGYLAVALLQQAGGLAPPGRAAAAGWPVAIFNLVLLGLAGALTAGLGAVYRRARRRLAALNQELERAHDRVLILNAEIQQAARLRVLGEVVASVVHELGNVLTAAVGHLEFAREKAERAAPEIAAHLGRVEQSLEAAMRIVRNALDTARTPAEHRVPVALAEVARQVVELKAYDLRRDGVAVHLDFPADLPPVLAAPYQLQQVLLNLVTNAQEALRAVAGPRRVAIAARREGADVIVEVADTGPGIPAEALPRLFEPFYTTKAGGTGLGLAISAAIARELGGELSAANRPGRGAIFRLRLPAAGAASAPGGALRPDRGMPGGDARDEAGARRGEAPGEPGAPRGEAPGEGGTRGGGADGARGGSREGGAREGGDARSPVPR